GAGCVFNTLEGKPCRGTPECTDSVCVPLDPLDVKEGVEAICVPHTALSSLACVDADECFDAGWPLEAVCEDGACTCSSVPDTCPDDLHLDANSCDCVENL